MYKMVFVLRDAADIQEQSKSRRKLKQILDKLGVPLGDVTVTYPDALERTIEVHEPNVIVTMGAEAFQSLFSTQEPLGLNRGELLEINGTKVIPTFHPGMCTQNNNWDNQEIIEYDIRKAIATSDTPDMPMRIGDNYTVVRDLETLREVADYIKSSKYCAFDIETEGFETFDRDEILCIQFSTREGEGIVVPLRGAWARHEVDTYSEYQLANYYERWVENKTTGEIRKCMSKTETKAIKESKPCFPAGSLVCQTPEVHIDKPSVKEHHCRGSVTDVWGGDVGMSCALQGKMANKTVTYEYVEVVDILRNIFEDGDCTFIAFNGKFDVRGLYWQLGIKVKHFLIDPMYQYHQFHEEPPHNLEFCRNRFTFVPNYDKELKEHLPKMDKKYISYAMVPNEVLWYYGAADADTELRLVKPLFDEIEKDNPDNGLWLFNNVDMPYNRALMLMETNGIKVDMDRFNELCAFYKEQITELKREIDTALTLHNIEPLDIYTNAHTLRKLLFESEGLGIPSAVVHKTEKTDEEKTDKKAFTAIIAWCNEKVKFKKAVSWGKEIRVPTQELLSEREIAKRLWKREIVLLIQKYKQAIQIRNNFLDGDPEKFDSNGMFSHIKSDGKIHPDYHQRTTSARLGCQNPNLQNQPNPDDEEWMRFYGYGIKTMYIPDDQETEIILEADYSSQEMRILAYLANEQSLMDVFMICPVCKEDFRPTAEDPRRPFMFRVHCAETGHEAQDLHRGTASKVFKVAYDAVTSQQRTFAKRVNFGLNYGQGPSGLGETIGVSILEAKVLIEDYMNAFPGIRGFQARTKFAVETGKKIPNAYGRWRHTYGVNEMREYAAPDDYRTVVSAKYRTCVNFPVQSSPADIMGNVTIPLYDQWGVEREDWKSVESHVIAHEIFGFHPCLELKKMNARLVNLVHDSQLWVLKKDTAEEAIKIITTTMEEIPFRQLSWFLPVDVKSGPAWGK